ncbi:MAG: pyridine nucleotide-disulfide oxidoreductase [Betaproteobacteria bacterium RBG_16_58_11]|nr:MAG: pyridine nucleotide-disulfide oxidoreductase [Betaproteobacteria bacterium RBG_16_58_11]
MEPIVIIGSGMAGYGLLRELRKLDRETPVTVITADEGAAYAKPSLSNALAAGKAPEQLANHTAAQIGASLHAQVLTHTRVIRIDTATRQVETDRGSVPYSRLVLALGADPIAHGVAGAAAGKILSVNDLGDYTRFRAALAGKKKVAILGGGLIGCEFANDLVAAGYEAAVVHLGVAPLDRILPTPIAQRLSEALAEAGVTWHFGRRAVSAEAAGEGIALTLDDGSVLTADVVLSAIGLRPRMALAQAAGVKTGRGIVVDRLLQTSVAGIYAMGDCAEVEGWVLPYVQPLLQQARALAATLAGKPTPVSYPAMPVVVKTPVLPLTIAPPVPNQPGQWHTEMEAACMVARFKDEQGNLQGFVLCGQAPALRSELTKQLPPVLS